MVDFPTPPFAEETAITLRTSRMLRCWGNPRWRRGSSGGAFERGSPKGFSCRRSLNVEKSLFVITSTCCMVLEGVYILAGECTGRMRQGESRASAALSSLDAGARGNILVLSYSTRPLQKC